MSTMVLMRNSNVSTKKKTLGRQKIEIKQLQNKSSKQVTFSKRRSGLFKKSGELAVLCGADVAAIVFSPNDKVFCFGYPSIDSVLHNYLFGTTTSSSSSSAAGRELVAVSEFNRVYREATKELAVVKKRAEEMKQTSSLTVHIAASEEKKTKMQMSWWEEKGIGSSEEPEHYMVQLKEMRRKVANRLEELMATTTTTTTTTTAFHGGNLAVVGAGGSSSRSFGFVFGAGRGS